MKKQFGQQQLILATVFYLVFTLIELCLDQATGIHWTSPREINNLFGLIAIGLLWIWYFVDNIRKK